VSSLGPVTDRSYDIVVFGATGFTGALTAEYLAGHAPEGTRCALAGRSREKLEQVRRRLGPGASDVPVLLADVGDPDSLKAMAEATKVVISTVGPYIRYGEPVVAACAAAGTDYVDLTGEPEFVDRMWLGYQTRAVETGARLVHSCGFDSIPYDLGVQFTVEQLPEGVPISVDGFMAVNASISGGTYQSAIEILSRLRSGRAVAAERRRAEGSSDGRRVHGVSGRPHPDEFAGGWVVPFPTIDPITVLRSARALDRYGPDFAYSHYAVVGPLPMMVGLCTGVGVAAGLAQIPPARDLMLKLMSSGDGPSEEKRAKSWFRVRFAARAGDGATVRTEVSGGDPGYSETSKMLAESALCLAFDDLPPLRGQLTPAVAMGDSLRRRLVAAGIKFSVLA
jgi:short subunit dehydrogenase-like uncharacterized protein